MKNSLEIKDEKQQLKKKCFDILNLCKREIRQMTSEEENKFNSYKSQIEALNNEMRNLQNNLKNEIKIKKESNKTMEFRLLRAINDVANNRNLDEVASIVSNNGVEEMRKAGLSYSGQLQLPMSELRSAVTVTTEGADVVATDIFDVLEPLRAKNVLIQAGAKFLTNLTGDVQVPLMSASNVTWEGETSSASDGAGTFSSVKLSPKRLTAYVDVSKQFLIQDSASAEAMIRKDIVNAINSKLEATILGDEAGTTTKPAGIFYTATSLDTVSSFADVAELESDIEDANVMGECKYIMSNKAKAALRTMQKGNGVGFVYENGTVDGTETFNTSHVDDTNVAYGDWSNLAIGQWGAIDLTIDPYTQAAKGTVRLVINAYFDAKVLREGAIAVASVDTSAE